MSNAVKDSRPFRGRIGDRFLDWRIAEPANFAATLEHFA